MIFALNVQTFIYMLIVACEFKPVTHWAAYYALQEKKEGD